jgi:hypothetical protein
VTSSTMNLDVAFGRNESGFREAPRYQRKPRAPMPSDMGSAPLLPSVRNRRMADWATYCESSPAEAKGKVVPMRA